MNEAGLEGRVALVAGASTGIGKAIALALAQHGADVALCARGKEKLDKTAAEINAVTGRRALPISADMTKLKDVKRFVATSAASFGRIDILAYSANTPTHGTFAELSDETWRYHLDVKLLGCIRCVREVIPHMQENQWGRIIIVAGMSARRASPTGTDNGTVCGALANFGKQVANQVASYGILVNTIHPGGTLTPRLEWAFSRRAQEAGTTVEAVIEQSRQEIPIGRLIYPEDIANLALFLCSQYASAITGQSIAVDGGAGTAIVY